MTKRDKWRTNTDQKESECQTCICLVDRNPAVNDCSCCYLFAGGVNGQQLSNKTTEN